MEKPTGFGVQSMSTSGIRDQTTNPPIGEQLLYLIGSQQLFWGSNWQPCEW